MKICLAAVLAAVVLWVLLPAASAEGTQGTDAFGFTVENGVITGYSGGEKDLAIPAAIGGQEVTAIGYMAFYGTDITSVSIPGSVAEIRNWAFANCKSLETVTMEEGIRKIGLYCFEQSGLKEIRIPDSVTEIGESTFEHCGSLTIVRLGNGLTELPARLFQNAGIRQLTIPGNITALGKYLTEGCRELATVTMLGEDVSFDASTFPEYREGDITRRNTYYSAPAGSSTLQRLKSFGLLCAETDSGITLQHALSRDPLHPTHVPAVDGYTIDLSNAEGFRVIRVTDFYTRADLPRNSGMWTWYQTDHEITDNRWTYQRRGAYYDSSAIVLTYEDGSGRVRRSEPYYLEYGVAELKEPVLTSHVFEKTKDGDPQIPLGDLEVSWTPSDNAVYSVILFEYTEGCSYTGRWNQEEIQENHTVIPADQLLPGPQEYMIDVTAIHRETGEELDMRSGDFKVFGSDYVKDEAKLTAPFRANTLSSQEEYCPVIRRAEEITFTWNPVENAVYYVFELQANLSSGGLYTVCTQQTEETSWTVTEDQIKWYADQTGIRSFTVVVGSFDRYGNATNNPKKSYHPTNFRFGDAAALEVRADGTALSMTEEPWTAMTAGTHTIQWKAADGADSYEATLIRKDGDSFRVDSQKTAGASETSAEFELADGYEYILVLYAKNGGQFLNGGWYYMNVNRENHGKPVILEPAADFFRTVGDVKVSWADTGAVRYKAALCRRTATDYDEETNIFGDVLAYYSTVVAEQEITGTSCTFPGELLEYGGMYRILVTAVYADERETKADHLFKTAGDPGRVPQMTGALMSEDPAQAPFNFRAGNLRIQWKNDGKSGQFEAALYTADESGKRLELAGTAGSRMPDMSISVPVAEEETWYELAVYEYDADGFSNEYRRYFRTGTGNLSTLRLPEKLQSIEDEAFMNNTAVEVVLAGEGLESIGAGSFRGCVNLKYIVLPASVRSVGKDAFEGCSGLTICCSRESAAYEYAAQHGIPVIEE